MIKMHKKVLEQLDHSKKVMYKLITVLFFLSAYLTNAQRTMFRGQNNYVAPVSPPSLVTSGLILNLDASAYAGVGNTWNDISGQNNTATLVGSPTFGTSPASFTFGPNKHATTTKSNISLTTATFIAWVNPSQTQGSYTGIVFNRSGNGGSTVSATGLDLYSNNSVGYHWNDTQASYNWNSNLLVPNNAWSMIAITVSANAATAYLCNSTGIATAINTNSHSTLTGLNFFIGCDPADKSSRAFVGKIATAMVYNSALSLSDITATFNAQKGSFGL
jgi:hypothetical protein